MKEACTFGKVEDAFSIVFLRANVKEMFDTPVSDLLLILYPILVMIL